MRICLPLLLLFGFSLSAMAATPRVVALVRDDLLPDLQERLAVWQADLQASGYTAIVESWPADQTATRNDNLHAQALWSRLRTLHRQPESLHGALFIGRFPSPVYAVENWDDSIDYYPWLDDGYWFLDTFTPKPDGEGIEPDIWVSRIDALDQKENSPHGEETELLRRYFDQLHAWRCGRKRYPDSGPYAISGSFNTTEVYDAFSGSDRRIDHIWAEQIEELYAEAPYAGKKMSEIYKWGGEMFIELAHGYSSGTGTQVGGLGLFYSQPNQIHFYGLASCNVNEIGGMCARSLFSRHGGALFASAVELPVIASFRVAWNNGDHLGHILLEDLGYPIQSYGDLTVSKTPACFSGNDLPTIDSFTLGTAQIGVGDAASFSATASDPDGITVHEFFPFGYTGGRGTGVAIADPAGWSYRYDVPHSYSPRLVVGDRHGAWMWDDSAGPVRVAPQTDRPLRINCGYGATTQSDGSRRDPQDADHFDAAGHRWLHDQGYAAGTWGGSGGSYRFEDAGIAGTNEDVLYQSFIRIDKVDQPRTYTLPLGDGTYTVRLHLAVADTDKVKNPGESLLDVEIEEASVATAIDVWAEAGDRRTALVRTFADVSVDDGVLDLVLARNAEATAPAAINAIEILPQGVNETAAMTLRHRGQVLARGDSHPLDDSRIGRTTTVALSVVDHGSIPLTCSDWTVTTTGCTAELLTTPASILPLERAPLRVAVTPDTTDWSATITTLTNDPGPACSWTLTGTATNAPAPGSLRVCDTALSLDEWGFAAVRVERYGGCNGAISVRCATVADGSASDDDFAAVDRELTWADGETGVRLVRIPIVNDTIAEDAETLSCRLDAATGGASITDERCTITILGNDRGGTIELIDTSLVVEEGDQLTVRLRRTGGTDATTLTLATARGSAQHPEDFPHTVETIGWAAGETGEKTFVVDTVDDSDGEGAESFEIVLGRAPVETRVVGSRCRAIIDANDTPNGVIEFLATTYEGEEGSVLRVTLVRRDVTDDSSASAIARLTGRTAVKDSDFENADDMFPSWGAGETGERYLDIPLLDDELTEDPETFAISLPSISGARLGAKGTVVVTILDDDQGNRTVLLRVQPLDATYELTCDETTTKTIAPDQDTASFSDLARMVEHLFTFMAVPDIDG